MTAEVTEAWPRIGGRTRLDVSLASGNDTRRLHDEGGLKGHQPLAHPVAGRDVVPNVQQLRPEVGRYPEQNPEGQREGMIEVAEDSEVEFVAAQRHPDGFRWFRRDDDQRGASRFDALAGRVQCKEVSHAHPAPLALVETQHHRPVAQEFTRFDQTPERVG